MSEAGWVARVGELYGGLQVRVLGEGKTGGGEGRIGSRVWLFRVERIRGVVCVCMCCLLRGVVRSFLEGVSLFFLSSTFFANFESVFVGSRRFVDNTLFSLRTGYTYIALLYMVATPQIQ